MPRSPLGRSQQLLPAAPTGFLNHLPLQNSGVGCLPQHLLYTQAHFKRRAWVTGCRDDAQALPFRHNPGCLESVPAGTARYQDKCVSSYCCRPLPLLLQLIHLFCISLSCS